MHPFIAIKSRGYIFLVLTNRQFRAIANWPCSEVDSCRQTTHVFLNFLQISQCQSLNRVDHTTADISLDTYAEQTKQHQILQAIAWNMKQFILNFRIFCCQSLQ